MDWKTVYCQIVIFIAGISRQANSFWRQVQCFWVCKIIHSLLNSGDTFPSLQRGGGNDMSAVCVIKLAIVSCSKKHTGFWSKSTRYWRTCLIKLNIYEIQGEMTE